MKMHGNTAALVEGETIEGKSFHSYGMHYTVEDILESPRRGGRVLCCRIEGKKRRTRVMLQSLEEFMKAHGVDNLMDFVVNVQLIP